MHTETSLARLRYWAGPVVAVASLAAFAASTHIAGAGSGAGESGRAPTPKFKAVFARPLTTVEVKRFANDNRLAPLSVTFRGSGFSCGGTIDSAADIDRVANDIARAWRSELADPRLEPDYKAKSAAHLAEVERDGFRVGELEAAGEAPARLSGDERVRSIVQR